MNAARSTPPAGTRRRIPVRRAQRGVALAISLVLLVAMTVVGIATLAGTRLNEKVTSNAQQKSVAFEVAESAIDSVRSRARVQAALALIPADEFDNPARIAPPGAEAALSNDFDQTRDARSTLDLDASVTIRYCGEGPPNGSDLNADTSRNGMVGLLVDINGVATVDGSAARADHVERLSIDWPSTGRRGACTSPGT